MFHMQVMGQVYLVVVVLFLGMHMWRMKLRSCSAYTSCRGSDCSSLAPSKCCICALLNPYKV